MAKSGFECNIENTFDSFMNLTATEMNKAVRRALRSGAKELQKQTKSNMTASMKTRNNTHWYDGKIVVYDDKIEDAVRISKIDGTFGNDLSIKVHVMGTRKSGSGTYRARFLEKGTRERFAKHMRNKNHNLVALQKPKSLGRINGKWFFKNAQSTVMPNLPSIYMAEIDKTINKLNNTKI